MRNSKWRLRQFAVTGNVMHEKIGWQRPEKWDKHKEASEPASETPKNAAAGNLAIRAKPEEPSAKAANARNGARFPAHEVVNVRGENVAVCVDLDRKTYAIIGRPSLVSSFFESVGEGQFADLAKRQAGLVIDEQLGKGVLLRTAEEHMGYRQSLKPGRQYSYYTVSTEKGSVSDAAESSISNSGRFRGWKKTAPPSVNSV